MLESSIMFSSAPLTKETGLHVQELYDADSVDSRPLRPRDPLRDIEGMQRLAQAFARSADDVLQQLVDLAVELCHADSAGISVVRVDGSAESYYEWVATAGRFHPFLNAILPQYPSACGVALDRNRPQHFRVDQRFFSLLGVTADPVLDGLLFPWKVGDTHGTIFITSSISATQFDSQDARVMQILADFAATALRQQQQQHVILQHAGDVGARAMANVLAHQINNPLQSLTNSLFLLQDSPHAESAAQASMALEELERLSSLVKELLTVYAADASR
jgi:signal transduction histidine kinase